MRVYRTLVIILLPSQVVYLSGPLGGGMNHRMIPTATVIIRGANLGGASAGVLVSDLTMVSLPDSGCLVRIP